MFENAAQESWVKMIELFCFEHKTLMTIKKPNVELFGSQSCKLVFVGDIKRTAQSIRRSYKNSFHAKDSQMLGDIYDSPNFYGILVLRSMSQNRKARICHKFLMFVYVFFSLSFAWRFSFFPSTENKLHLTT